MGPTWVLSAPDGPHVGPMNLAIRVVSKFSMMQCFLVMLNKIELKTSLGRQGVWVMVWWAVLTIFVYKHQTTFNLILSSLIAKFMGPTWGPPWGRQDPSGPHVGPMNLAIWDGSFPQNVSLEDLDLKMNYFMASTRRHWLDTTMISPNHCSFYYDASRKKQNCVATSKENVLMLCTRCLMK